MDKPRHIAVIDIGKTNAKLALVDLPGLVERAVITRPNPVLPGPPWPHYDTEGLWDFLLAGLADFHARHGVDAISITTHGACAAFLAKDGRLAAPVLDYEHDYPAAVIADYSALRPDFGETGSPRLAHGLNLGAQLHYQLGVDPDLRARTAHIVTWPQYWAHRLTGVAATDVTSLGCHTDLWNPATGQVSSLVDTLAIGDLIAAARQPGDLLGPILPAVAAATGLGADTPVACGIHDSNASLYPHLLSRTLPFSVVSTGTWVVVMTVGGSAVRLDPARDTLINVNAWGQPVPSARFMGGREYEVIHASGTAPPTPGDVRAVLDGALLLFPAVEPATGPFQGRLARWSQPLPSVPPARRNVALSFYLALMTAECLTMTGATGPVIVEGPFARNRLYLDMLAAASGLAVAAAASLTGTAIGAALLYADRPGTGIGVATPTDTAPDPQMIRYARKWRAAVAQG